MLTEEEFNTIKEIYNSIISYRKYYCNFNNNLCYFHSFKDKNPLSYCKSCAGKSCENYQNTLSFLEMCKDCEYSKPNGYNTGFICTYIGHREIDRSEFHKYKCLK